MFFRELNILLSKNKKQVEKLYLNNFEIYDHDNNKLKFTEAILYIMDNPSLTLRGHVRWFDKNHQEIYILFESNLPIDESIYNHFNIPESPSFEEFTDEIIVSEPKLTPFIFTENQNTPFISPVDDKNYYIRLVLLNDNKSINHINFSVKSSETNYFTPYVRFDIKDINENIVKSEVLVDVENKEQLNDFYSIYFKNISDSIPTE